MSTATRARAPLAALLVVVTVLAGCQQHEFLRITEDPCGGRLEAAWVWFDPPPGHPPVLLVNMVHFGTWDYYDEVQRELDRATVVFIEWIRAPETRSADAPEYESFTQLNRAVEDLAFELRLVPQREALTIRPEYRCVDWTVDRLLEHASLEPYLGGVTNIREIVQRIVDLEVEELRRAYPELKIEDLASFARRGPLRRQVAERLVTAPHEHAAIIRGRNEEVLRGLLGVGPTDVVAICYGADHGPHLARSLDRLGYRRQRPTWHRIFGFDREPHPDVIPLP
jgi:hypothetical protein